jgi:uncharacterized FAD-dependent dehydrogenase
MSRRTARDTAVKLVYQADIHKDGLPLEDFLASSVDSGDTAYIKKVVEGVAAHTDELVEAIGRYSANWPVNRISSGFDLGNLTPVKGLFVVGDGAKGKGGIEVEGVALGVRNMLELFEKAYS